VLRPIPHSAHHSLTGQPARFQRWDVVDSSAPPGGVLGTKWDCSRMCTVVGRCPPIVPQGNQEKNPGTPVCSVKLFRGPFPLVAQCFDQNLHELLPPDMARVRKEACDKALSGLGQ
jgi:hypothetical protein